MRSDPADFSQQINIFFTAGFCPSNDEIERRVLDELQNGTVVRRMHNVPLFRVQCITKRAVHLGFGIHYEYRFRGDWLSLYLGSNAHGSFPRLLLQIIRSFSRESSVWNSKRGFLRLVTSKWPRVVETTIH